ncbi:MAG: hypothetical protein MK132_10820 [Lentisphaerales bacterium]|nr:hypothetical protein [Lentisphaerales bacterium]
MTENNSESVEQRPVAGMRSLALGAFCAFGVFAIAIAVGMTSVMAGKRILIESGVRTPLEISYNKITEETYSEAMRKMNAFGEQASSQSKLEFSLSADELNSLIIYNEEFKALKGVAKFKIDEDEISAVTSFPLKYVAGLKGEGDGLFLNGETRYQVFVKKDELRVFLEGFYQQGERMEVDAIHVLQQINLLEHWAKYESLKDKLALVQEVVCKEGKLIFRNWKTPEKS